MEHISIKTYAVRHKLSIFNVMKMLKSGQLKSLTKKENGRDVIYVLLDEEIEKTVKKGIVPLEGREEADLKEEIKYLKKEIYILRDDFEMLKKNLMQKGN